MSASNVRVSRIQIEHLRETLGIGAARPRLSWQVETSIQGWQQAGYAIECYDADGLQIGHDMVYIQWQKDADGNLAKQVVWPSEGKSAEALYPLPPR